MFNKHQIFKYSIFYKNFYIRPFIQLRQTFTMCRTYKIYSCIYSGKYLIGFFFTAYFITDNILRI